MRLTYHLTLNFNNNMSTAVVFLEVERAFDTTWHLGLLYKLSKLKFSISLVKVISSFLSQRKFRVSVDSEMSTPRDIQARVPQGSILPPHCTVCLYMIPPDTWCLSRSLCWWHLYICDKPHRRLCSQKAAARSQCCWDLMWALENKNQRR
jgi:hypothetical protein